VKLLALSLFLLAAQPPAAPPGGCDGYQSYAEFDFWVGEWNVYGRDGAFAGQNRISRESSGCLLLERWRSAAGREGSSINFVDPDSRHWRQIWMGPNNFIDLQGGLTETGQMRLDGRIVYFSEQGARDFEFRGVWTPVEEGRVVQHFQQLDPESGTWQDWALLTYVPRGDDPNGPEPAGEATGPRLAAPPPIGAVRALVQEDEGMSGIQHVHHEIDYIELEVTDMEAAKRFYTAAFGWAFNDYGPGYAGIRKQAGGEAGGLRLSDEVSTGGPLVILYSDDLEVTLQAVRAAGGRITQEPFAFPGGRRFHFEDPSGNRLAVWAVDGSADD
jgi:predicted enzyme related to lactoylglutathione lyase